MKPRTQYQKMVCKSDKGTAPIAKRVIKWAADELTEHYAYRYPNSLRHTCMECGHQWNITDAEKRNKHLTCPHCRRRLEAKDTRDRTLYQSAYFTMLTTRKGLQVLSVAQVKTEHRKGEPAKSTCREICRYYMDDEILWSLGMTFINQFYSSRGLNAVAALNITGTAWNLFCVIMFAMGSAVSIMVGQRLGAGKMDEARDVDRKLIFLTEVIHVIIGLCMILTSGLVPKLYNVGPEVQELTRQMLIVAGFALPIHSFAHVTYFTIRSGGRTVITFFFDALYTWLVTVVLAFLLTRFTDMPIVQVYFCVQFIDILKVVIGLLMLRSDFWARNVVND